MSTYLQVASYIQQALGGAPVIGPELARPALWQHELPRVHRSAPRSRRRRAHVPPQRLREPARGDARRAALGAGRGRAAAARLGRRRRPRARGCRRSSPRPTPPPAVARRASQTAPPRPSGRCASCSPRSRPASRRFASTSAATPTTRSSVDGEQLLTRPLESAMAALNRWLPIGSSLSSLAGVRGLDATRLTTPAGDADAGARQRQRAAACGRAARHAERARRSPRTAAHAGLQSIQLNATRGRVKLDRRGQQRARAVRRDAVA